jgi:hypothetical protein
MNELRGPLVVLAAMCIYNWSLNRKIRDLEITCAKQQAKNEMLISAIEEKPEDTVFTVKL